MLKLIFWIALIAVIVYFSGDIQFKDKSLKEWATSLTGEGPARVVDDVKETVSNGIGASQENTQLLNRLLKTNRSGEFSEEELKQLRKLIREELTEKDRGSMNDLMKSLGDDAAVGNKDVSKSTKKTGDVKTSEKSTPAATQKIKK